MKRWSFLTLWVLLSVARPAIAALVECVAVIIDGKVICLTEVEEQEALLEKLGEFTGKDAREEALDLLIERTLVESEAERLGLGVTDEDVERAVEEIRLRNGLDDQAFRAALAAQGLPYDKYLEQIRSQILQVKLAGQVLRPQMAVTDQALREFYLKSVADYRERDRVHLLHIQFPVSYGREQAEAVRDRAIAGEDFAALARKISTGPAADRGGDMGMVSVENLSIEVRSAVADVPEGGVSKLMEIRAGEFHLFKVAERRKGRIPSFEEVRDKVQDRYFEDREKELYESWIESLREKARIERKL